MERKYPCYAPREFGGAPPYGTCNGAGWHWQCAQYDAAGVYRPPLKEKKA